MRRNNWFSCIFVSAQGQNLYTLSHRCSGCSPSSYFGISGTHKFSCNYLHQDPQWLKRFLLRLNYLKTIFLRDFSFQEIVLRGLLGSGISIVVEFRWKRFFKFSFYLDKCDDKDKRGIRCRCHCIKPICSYYIPLLIFNIY